LEGKTPSTRKGLPPPFQEFALTLQATPGRLAQAYENLTHLPELSAHLWFIEQALCLPNGGKPYWLKYHETT
jgi:hypothetical protein